MRTHSKNETSNGASAKLDVLDFLFVYLYSSTLKQIIKGILRNAPKHRPTIDNLLRHQYLEPYLLLCHSASSVFLSV